MDAILFAVLIIAVLVIVTLARSVRIVPQARAAVVERLGRYTRTQGPGVAILLPFVDRMRPLIDMREQVVSFPPQPVITSDNLTVSIDSVIYFQVTDPRAASYEIQNYIQAVEQLTITTLRNVVGSLNLEQTLTSRDGINTQLRGVLDEATGPWGIRVSRVEIKAIEPPPSIRDAMEKQMRADRDKRAIILTAEGQRESAIKTAEGQKAAQILNAEGAKTAAILSAEAERQSKILRAEGERAARYLSAQGEAKAIETTFNAIHAAKPDPALLAYQYLQTLPQIAQGDANKMWIVPSEFSKALEGLAGLAGVAGGGSGSEPGGSTPSWLSATSAGPATSADTEPGDKIATDGWFDSNLPPAALQPEAAIVRGSDSDPDSLLAHQGLTAAALASSAGLAGSTGSAGTASASTASALPAGSADGAEPATAQVRPAEER
ncbi:MAG TPA: SPFH domain-containing protein [Jatrophihabitans sp.]|jgi:regulator of protease activity HflC (stomatin/prohibitin superfamily)|uniref:SPFH domain-containing protein n=1 Tax=Jatrophihabitans sp. TaxID=1932789 RepID=UPI002EF332C7